MSKPVKVTKEEIKHLADLIMVALTPEEISKQSSEMEEVIKSVSRLQELNTEKVKETHHISDLTNVLREDTPEKSLSQEEALSNAPSQEDGYFKVPGKLTAIYA